MRSLFRAPKRIDLWVDGSTIESSEYAESQVHSEKLSSVLGLGWIGTVKGEIVQIPTAQRIKITPGLNGSGSMTAEILAPTHALPCIEKLVYQYPSVVIHSDHLEVVKFLNTGEMNPTLRRTHPDLILHFQALDKSAKPYKGRLKAVLSVRTEEQVKSSPIRSKAANQRINPIASQTFTPDVFM